jgi:hypothetical protein
MASVNSRIEPDDTVILFADLQAGIVERSQTKSAAAVAERRACLGEAGEVI